MRVKGYFPLFLEHKKREGCAVHTMHEYERFIRETLCCIGEKRVSQLRINDRSAIMELGRQHGVWGEQRAVSCFICFLKFLRDEGIRIPFRPQDIMLPRVEGKEQDYFTPEEFEDFVAKLPTNFYGTRDRVLYELLMSTGLRINEALSCDISNIDFRNKEIKVKTLKGGEGDKVYVSNRLEYWLKKWLEIRADKHPALFINYHLEVTRLKRSMSNKRMLMYLKEQGITKKLSHKSFRTGFATYAMEGGANIKEVQVLCRHRSPQTTLKYYLRWQKTKVKEVHHKIFDGLKTKFKNFVFNETVDNC